MLRLQLMLAARRLASGVRAVRHGFEKLLALLRPRTARRVDQVLRLLQAHCTSLVLSQPLLHRSCLLLHVHQQRGRARRLLLQGCQVLRLDLVRTRVLAEQPRPLRMCALHATQLGSQYELGGACARFGAHGTLGGGDALGLALRERLLAPCRLGLQRHHLEAEFRLPRRVRVTLCAKEASSGVSTT